MNAVESAAALDYGRPDFLDVLGIVYEHLDSFSKGVLRQVCKAWCKAESVAAQIKNLVLKATEPDSAACIAGFPAQACWTQAALFHAPSPRVAFAQSLGQAQWPGGEGEEGAGGRARAPFDRERASLHALGALTTLQ